MSLYPFAKRFWIEHDWWFEWSFSFFGCFTLVYKLSLFPNFIREILLFYIANNWRDFLMTVFDKCFWVCWNAFIFSKHFQLQSIILMLLVQTSSSICKVCKYKVFRSHSSKIYEWTRHISMLRYQIFMKIAQIVV